LRCGLRSGGRGADPRHSLKECTPMIHDGISVSHLQGQKNADNGPAL
jgi:hypothetical protein